MDRRGFFKHLGHKVSEKAIEHVEKRVNDNAIHWIRPPYALSELEFLLACTRCNQCIEACTYNVIFPLPARRGGQVVNTPAMDLLNHGCHMCDDWPCVAVCEPGALKLVEQDDPVRALPKLAKAIIDTSACLPYQGPDCGACEASCPVPDALQWRAFKPSINAENCTGCAMCRVACIVEPKAVLLQSLGVVEQE